MLDSPNVSVVRRLYQARGNPEVIRQVLASDVRWEVVDGFPHGAVYVGLDSVLRDFFGRLFTDFDEFVANGSEFFESGEHVIALGSYSGRARRSGKRFRSFRSHLDIARRADCSVAAVSFGGAQNRQRASWCDACRTGSVESGTLLR
jgi:ketosteroid isomerase-like protein